MLNPFTPKLLYTAKNRIIKKLKQFLLFFTCTIFFTSDVIAINRAWVGAGAGGTGTDLATSSNWSPAGVPGPGDACTMNFGLVPGTYSLIQSSSLNMNSLTITLAASSGTVTHITIDISKDLVTANGLSITNSSSGPNDHEIDLNITAGNAVFGSVTTSATGTGGSSGSPSLYINISPGASLNCTGNWSSATSTGSFTATYIDNRGILTINGSTTGNCNGNKPVSFLTGNIPAVTTFAGNASFGPANDNGLNSTILGGSAAGATGSFVFKGDLVLGKTMATNAFFSTNGIFLFDGNGTQAITDNSKTYYIYPGILQIGSSNSPAVNIINGTATNPRSGITPYSSLIVNNNSTLQIGAGELLNSYSYVSAGMRSGILAVNSNAVMQLPGTTGGQTGSNFPNGYASYALNSASTVEYNAATAQTIYSDVVYGNLVLTNPGNKIAGGNLDIATDLTINSGCTFSVNSANSYSVTLGRNWTNNGMFNAFNGIVMFHSAQNAIITGTSPTAFYKLGINKGSSVATTIDITGTGAITATAGNTLADTSGLLRINSNASFSKTGSGIMINSDAGIQVNGGIFTLASNASLQNDGLFQIISGTAVIGNSTGNELRTTGTGTTDVKGGMLNIAGRLVNTAGTLSISGGAVMVCTIGNASATFGSFNLSLSTDFSMSGGTVSFQNAGAGSMDLHILNSTGTKAITGGEFIFGMASTPANSIFRCSSDVPLYDLRLDQNSPSVDLTKDLTVNGNLTLQSGILDINGKTITLNGSLSHSGGSFSGSSASNMVLNGPASRHLYFGNGNHILKNLSVNSSAANVQLDDSLSITGGSSFGVLTVDGVLNTNNYLTLKSDAGGTAMIAPSMGIISGNVTVERFIPSRRAWRFLSVPFGSISQTINEAWQEGKVNVGLDCSQNKYVAEGYGTEITYTGNANGFDDNITGNPSIKAWNNNAWTSPNSTYIPINTYPAYCLFVRGDRTICLYQGTDAIATNTVLRATGILNENGTGITKIFSGSPGDFLFIGNPFASPVDLKSVFSHSSGIVDAQFWVWDPKLSGAYSNYNVGGYVTYDNGIMTPSGIGGSYDTPTSVIQNGQAFMVKLNSGNASIQFQQNDKSPAQLNVFGLQVQRSQSPPAIYANLITYSENVPALVDGVAAGFGKQFSASVDDNDAAKLWNFDENMALVRNGNTLAIEFRPVPKFADTLFFRLYLRQQPYTLQIFSKNLPADIPAQAWIIDKYLDTQMEINLYDTTLYSFVPDLDTNSYRNRFMLVFSRAKSKNTFIVKKDKIINNEKGVSGHVNILPNPADTDTTILEFMDMDKGCYQVITYNSKGKSCNLNYSGGNNIYPLTLNVLWQTGVYTISIKNRDIKKIINLRLAISRRCKKNVYT